MYSTLYLDEYDRNYDLRTNYAVFDSEYAIPGESLPITVGITNLSDTMVTDVDVSVKDGDGNVVANDSIEMALASGNSENVIVFMTIPETINSDTYTVEAVIKDHNEFDTDNNAAEFTLYKTNVSVDASYHIDETEAIAAFKVENLSYVPASGTITVEDENGDILLNETFDNIDFDSPTDFSISIDNEFFGDEDGMVLYYTVTSDKDEYYDYNNKGELYVEKNSVNEFSVTVKSDGADDIIINASDVILLSDIYEKGYRYFTDYGNENETEITELLKEGIFATDHDIVIQKTIMMGDVNGDGEITDTDAALVLKYISTGAMLDSDATKNKRALFAADINGKEGIDMLDVIKILEIAGVEAS